MTNISSVASVGRFFNNANQLFVQNHRNKCCGFTKKYVPVSYMLKCTIHSEDWFPEQSYEIFLALILKNKLKILSLNF